MFISINDVIDFIDNEILNIKIRFNIKDEYDENYNDLQHKKAKLSIMKLNRSKKLLMDSINLIEELE